MRIAHYLSLSHFWTTEFLCFGTDFFGKKGKSGTELIKIVLTEFFDLGQKSPAHHASTNVIDYHRYFPLSMHILPVPFTSRAFWWGSLSKPKRPFFLQKEITPKLLTIKTKVCSVLVNIRDVLRHQSVR